MVIRYGNTLNGLVEKNVVEVCWIYEGHIVFDFTTHPLVCLLSFYPKLSISDHARLSLGTPKLLMLMLYIFM